jgi:hypothetical protein
MTEPPISTDAYDHVVVIDTQVVLETKPLDQLPWSEVFPGRVLLLVCRQVQWEIDARKQDGRHSKRARSFNALLDGFIETRTPVPLAASLQVDVALLRNGLIDWDALPDLDREEGDDKIVAQALNAVVDDPSRILVFSHDMRPRDAAIVHGLMAVKLPEAWLKDPEPSPDQRRIADLEGKVRLLSIDQPELKVTIELVTPEPWEFREFGPVSAEVTERLYRERLAKAPPQSRRSSDRFGSIATDYLIYDSSHGERLEQWREHLRLDTPRLGDGLTRLFAQRLVRVRVENVGSVSAEGLSLDIRSGNAKLRSRPYWILFNGPTAPEPRMPHAAMLDIARHAFVPPHREPHQLYWDEVGPGASLQLSCASVRQEKLHEVEISVELLSRTAPKAHIEAVVTASNLRGDARMVRAVPVASVVMAIEDIYDPDAERLKERPAVDMRDAEDGSDFVLLHNDGSEYRSD